VLNAPQLTAYGHTHVGTVREENQDSFRVSTAAEPPLQAFGALYAVADGMGGYEHGAIASAQAIETFYETFYQGNPQKPPQNLKNAVQAANWAVYQASQRLRARMGTTLSALNIMGNQLHLSHIGDSRVYLVRGRNSTCLTNDHTAVGELVRMRVLSPDKVRTHERRSVLQKCLGMQLVVQPDVSQHKLAEGDYLILCTDGVWSHVEDQEFVQIAIRTGDPEPISRELIDLAMQRESDDNLSVITIHIQKVAPQAETSGERRMWGLPQALRGKLMGKA